MPWVFNSGADSFDYLADGEVVTLTYTLRVTDSAGSSADAHVTINITGTNDGPSTSVVDVLGSITESSVQFTADHVLTDDPGNMVAYEFSSHGGQLFELEVTGTTEGPLWGTNEYTHDSKISTAAVHAGLVDVGETKTVYILISEGLSVYESTESNGIISSSYSSWPTTFSFVHPESVGLIADSGSFLFSDLDYTDRPVATELTASIAAFEPDGITTLTLTADQQQSIEDAFTVHLSDDSTNNGAVHWTYSIDEVDLNFLAAGESVEAVFTVSIIDQIGASSSQDVSILLTGSNDAPTTLLSSVPLPSLAEDTSSQASIQDLFNGSGSNAAFTDAPNDNSGDLFAGVALVANDAFNTQGYWQYKAPTSSTWLNVSTPANPLSLSRALFLPADYILRFQPSPNWNGVAGSLTARLADDSVGTLPAPGTRLDISSFDASGGTSRFSDSSNAVQLTASVTPVNDAPTVSLSTAFLSQVGEDNFNPPGASVASFVASSYSDATDVVDGGSNADAFEGIAITAYNDDPSQGIWQYSTNEGVSWIELPPVSGASSALSLLSSDWLRFVPAPDFNGTAPTIDVVLVDSSTSLMSGGLIDASTRGGTTPYSAGTVVISHAVEAINDAPLLNPPATFDLIEDTTGNLTFTATTFSDVDSGSGSLQAILSISDGYLRIASGNLGGVSLDPSSTPNYRIFTGTAASLNNFFSTPGNITYTPALNNDTERTLTLTVNDQGHTGSGGPLSATATSVVLVEAVSDDPSITSTDVIKIDFSAVGDSDGGDLSDWNGLSHASSISNVKRYEDSVIVPGISLSVNGSGSTNDPAGANWPGTDMDPYYLRSADDVIYSSSAGMGLTGKASELNITAEGLDPERLYTLRVYSLLDVPGRDPMDVVVTNGSSSIEHLNLDRQALFQSVPLSTDLIFANVSPDASGSIVVSLGSNDGVAVQALVIEPVATELIGLSETDSSLSTTGSFRIQDPDRNDTVLTNVQLSVSGTSDRTDPAAPSNAVLEAMFNLSSSTILNESQVSNVLDWSFDSASEAFNYLGLGETLVLEYTVSVTDNNSIPLSDSETVTVTITGTNDSPLIESRDSVVGDASALTETDALLMASGSFVARDLDTTDFVSAGISAVSLSGSFTESGSVLPISLGNSEDGYPSLLAMLTLENPDAAVLMAANDAESGSEFGWSFRSGDSGDGAFDFLQEGETLTLTYSIDLTDISGDSSTNTTSTTVAVTITGTNDQPVITLGDDNVALSETNSSISATDTMVVVDPDLSDTISASVESVAITGGTYPSADVPLDNAQLLGMLSLSSAESFLEVGTITDLADSWQTINLRNSFENPVIIVSDPTNNDPSDAAAVRLRNITSDSFEIRLFDSDPLGIHAAELVSFLVVEQGSWQLPDGTRITADFSTVSGYQSLQPVTLDGSISSPVVLTQIQSLNNEHLAYTRTNSISSTGFDVSIEASAPAATSEQIGWLAIDSGVISFDGGAQLSANLSADIHDDTVRKEVFSVPFSDQPAVIAKLATLDGGDDANLRLSNISSSGFDVRLDEPPGFDGPHTSERIAYLAIGGLTGSLSALPLISVNESLLSSTSTIPADPIDGSQITWAFGSGPVSGGGDEAFEFLASGESLELTYTVAVTDSSAAISGESVTDTSTVTVTITGTNDTPQFSVFTGDASVAEDSALLADELTASGNLNFSDLDLTDFSLLSRAFVSATPSSGASVSSSLLLALEDLDASFVLEGDGASTAAHDGSATWSFTVDNALTQYLAAGEWIDVVYRVSVTDDSGFVVSSDNDELHSSSRDVTLRINGTNDAPVVYVVDADNNEFIDLPQASINLSLAAVTGDYQESGILRFRDVDFTDRPTATFTLTDVEFFMADTTAFDAARWSVNSVDGVLLDEATSTSQLVNGHFDGQAFSLLSDPANTNVGDVAWAYETDAASTAFLQTGEKAVLTYTISFSDDNGAISSQDVEIHVSANAPPLAVDDLASVREDAGFAEVAHGDLTANDTDLEGDPLSVSEIRFGAVEGSGVSGTVHPALTGLTFMDPSTGSTPVMARLDVDPAFGHFEAGEYAGITIVDGDNTNSLILSGTWSDINAYLQSPWFKFTLYAYEDNSPDANSAIRDIVQIQGQLHQLGETSQSLGAPIAGATAELNLLPPGNESALSTFTALDGSYGRLIVQSNGSYAYHLNNDQLDVQQLGADDTLSEVFNYTLSDGYTYGAGLLTLTINGTDDRPVITGEIISGVQELGVSPGINLTAPADTAFGRLHDIDLDEGFGVGFTATVTAARTADGGFAPVPLSSTSIDGLVLVGDFGQLTIGADGSYAYQLNNSNSSVDSLAEGELIYDHFLLTLTSHSVNSEESYDTVHEQPLVIEILGTNDQPVIETISLIEGSVIESGLDTGLDVVGENAYVSGVLISSDVDNDSTAYWSIEGTSTGTYGSISIDQSTGEWTYTLANSDPITDSLDLGDSVIETFTARVTDDNDAYVDQTIHISITGSNDRPVITSYVLGSATESGNLDNGDNIF